MNSVRTWDAQSGEMGANVLKCNFLKITARISAGRRKQLVVIDMLLFRCSWYHCLRGAQKVRALTKVGTVLNWLNYAPLYRWKWPTINRFHFPAERSALFTDSHFVASLGLSVSFLKGEKKILISIKTLPLRLVHTSDGIGSGVGIGSARSVTIQCKSKIRSGSGVGSSTESESEGSEEFLFLPIPLPLPSLPIQWEQGERNRNRKRNYQPIKKLITSPFQT